MPKKKPTLGSRRPTIKSVDEDKAQAFIGGAEEENKNDLSPTPQPKPTATKPAKKIHPWESRDVRSDQTKTYLLRLPEPYMLKLQFIRQRTGRSMQHVCHEALLPYIDAQIKDILSDK